MPDATPAPRLLVGDGLVPLTLQISSRAELTHLSREEIGGPRSR